MEDVAYACLKGIYYLVCGFRHWWSNDLWKQLFDNESTMIPNAAIVGDE